ncbi:mannitol-1-phosphate 5-dehydrogenase [Lihuaxuella thermophila]|uniref:Mannitol-1-phosphate 5-dehydrogenase n=1 Tax=Lihuaxuella thermophila TaxID=1173111 RepID=A0A1H8ICR9_9BACL|nr:mannitol-1-phosphate 5-dehydrogenase [Lihuaxuella thermophila]SEN65916.1 mannitol-1-phosphate 5-dehydrogenase [Lihuaxuella thermophila]
MKALHFGAGNIGRGFIGALLNQAGYEVCFVDVVQELVDEINQRGEYIVEIAGPGHENIKVSGVRAINGLDQDAVTKEMIEADLVTTAVGPNVLKQIAPAIANGLAERINQHAQPLNIIACENVVGGSTLLKEYIHSHLNEADRQKAAQIAGFPDAAVDRIVPLQNHEDKLRVTVEPFYEWVVDQDKIVGELPRIEGITYVRNLQPYIERKLYTVNTGHATAAYLGYHFGYKTIDEALRDEYIRHVTGQAIMETGRLLVAKHRFDPDRQEQYIHQIMERFSNPYLSDEVTRIGRSPIRKLGPNDRLVGPAVQAEQYGIIPEHLCTGIAAAFLFDYDQDAEAVKIQAEIRERGLAETIRHYTNIEPHSSLFQFISEKLELLKEMKSSPSSKPSGRL